MVNIPDVTAVQRLADVAAVREPTTLANEAALAGKPAGQYNLTATSETVAWNGSTVTARGPLPAKATDTAAAQAAAAGLGNQLQPATLDAVPDGVGRAWLGDLEHRPYTGSDPVDGTIVKQDAKGRKWAVNFTGIAQVDWWNTVESDGSADVADGISEAGEWARKKGKPLAAPAGGRYLLETEAILPRGVELAGQHWIAEDPRKGNGSANLTGSVFIVRGQGGFLAGTAGQLSRIVALYDQQHLMLELDPTSPDGLTDFIDYPALVRSTDNYGAPTMSEILFLGGSKIFEASGPDSNPEKLVIRDIRGAFTDTAVRIPVASDVPRIRGMFLNPNSLYAMLAAQCTAAGKMDQYVTYLRRLHTKIAKNTTVFDLGRVDDIKIDDCFAYGVRDFAYLRVIDPAREAADNLPVRQGGGVTITNCDVDCCHHVLHIDRDSLYFGIRVDDMWCATNVWEPVYNGTALPAGATPSLLHQEGSPLQGSEIQFSNIRVYGGPVEQIADSKAWYCALTGDAGANRVKLTNADFEGGSVLHSENYSRGGVAGKHLLAGSGTTFNGKIQTFGALPWEGQYLGAVAPNNPTAQVRTVGNNQRFMHSQGVAMAATAPTGIGLVAFYVGDTKVAHFAFPAGRTYSDPLFVDPAWPSLVAGAQVRVVLEGMGGASDISWRALSDPSN